MAASGRKTVCDGASRGGVGLADSRGLKVADIDGDGDLDVLVVTELRPDNDMYMNVSPTSVEVTG
jgi:hypothetical protein